MELGKFDEREGARRPRARAAPRRPETCASGPRPTWCGMHVRLHKAEPGSWSDATLQLTTETIPLLEQEGAHAELARAWRLVALVKQIAGAFGHGRRRDPQGRHARARRRRRAAGRAQRARPDLQRALRADAGAAGARAMRGVRHRRAARPPGAGADHVQARAAARDERRVRERAHDVPPGARRCSTTWARACAWRSRRSISRTIELLAGDPAAAEREVRADYETLVQMGATYFISSMAASSRAPCVRRAATRKRSS